MLILNDEFKTNVGKRLREVRIKKGLKIKDVAEKLSSEYY